MPRVERDRSDKSSDRFIGGSGLVITLQLLPSADSTESPFTLVAITTATISSPALREKGDVVKTD